MPEILFFVVCAVVVPVLINKSTEGERFNWLKPYLRESWTVLFVFFSAYFLLKPEAKDLLMQWHSKAPGVIGYLLASLCGAALLCAYWYFTGLITPSEKKTAEVATTSPSTEATETAKPEEKQNIPKPEEKLPSQTSELLRQVEFNQHRSDTVNPILFFCTPQ